MNLNFNGILFSLAQPAIMGIVNYTEDSFFDGGRYNNEKALLLKVEQLLEEGADIIDLGAISTRPGAKDLDEQTEFERIKSAIRIILSNFPDTFLSVDTWRSSVAEMAVNEGAVMINDISGGLFDDKMLATVARLKIPYCLMHTTAKPEFMQQKTSYDNIIADMLQFFGTQIQKLTDLGMNDIIIDPGFGFGKTLEQNYFLLKNLRAFSIFNLPILVGISRKSMIYQLLETTPDFAINGTTVLNTISLMNGASILRVHDVKAAKETVLLVQQLK